MEKLLTPCRASVRHAFVFVFASGAGSVSQAPCQSITGCTTALEVSLGSKGGMNGGLRPNITSKGVNPVETLIEVLKLHFAQERNLP